MSLCCVVTKFQCTEVMGILMNSSRVSCQLADHVATVTFQSPPHNFLDIELVKELGDQFEAMDATRNCRVIVLNSVGGVFCAGANFSESRDVASLDPWPFYTEAMRLFNNRKPIVAAVQGAAVGAGLGLSLVADFRIGSPQARFSANFNRLGIHPGFGMSKTLPHAIGVQGAARLFYTGERIGADRALALGLIDAVSEDQDPLGEAQALAQDIARSAPEAVQSTRSTLRAPFVQAVMEAIRHECAVQLDQFRHPDFREGVRAAAERRVAVFSGS